MNKTTFAILTLLFNAYGVPCFIQGDKKTGIIRIVLSLVCCVMGLVNSIMGIILAVQIFKMTDEEFAAAYGTLDKGIPAANFENLTSVDDVNGSQQ